MSDNQMNLEKSQIIGQPDFFKGHACAHCCSHLAFRFGDILTNVLGPIRALLHKDRLARLCLPLHPDDGLVGGHVHAELLVVQVNGLAGLRGPPVTVLVCKVCVSSSPLLLRAVFQLRCDVQRLMRLPWVLPSCSCCSRLNDNSSRISRDGGDSSGGEYETQPHGVADWSLFESITGLVYDDKIRQRSPATGPSFFLRQNLCLAPLAEVLLSNHIVSTE